MASLISCPHCGPRPKEEFTVKGAALARPEADADTATWFDHVYLRENPRGLYDERLDELRALVDGLAGHEHSPDAPRRFVATPG